MVRLAPGSAQIQFGLCGPIPSAEGEVRADDRVPRQTATLTYMEEKSSHLDFVK